MKRNSETELSSARKVFTRAKESVEALDQWLNEPFLEAVELIARSKGRLIISGMGKSGHVAHKIAATMSSTGTPAFFVHPGEASHGDLGMVTDQDVLMLLSNSGETKELKDMIVYSRRFSIPLISMVRRHTSQLVHSSDVALILPEIPEATHINAPTTSTTMMMVLGDALAVALLERRGFTAQEFSVYHPGGKLGAAFITVSELMRTGKKTPSVFLTTPMSEVLIEMSAKSLGCVAVTNENGHVMGVITDGDLRRHMSPDIIEKRAKEVMTSSPVTIHPKKLASEALALMEEKTITSLFVIKDNKLIGVLHIHDILSAGVA